MNLKKNALYETAIQGYSSEGAGVARVENQVVFVRGAIRGERCVVRLLKVGKTAAYGKVERLLEQSPERREPDCLYFGKCGGCAFWHMSYEEELEAKRLRVEDALRRIGGQNVAVSVIIGSDNTESYRNKAQYPVSQDEEGRAVTGFYRARSHDVIPVARCLIQSPMADEAAAAVREWMDEFSVPAYDERTGEGLVRHVYVRTAGGTGQTLVCLVAAASRLPRETELVERIRARCPDTAGVVLSSHFQQSNVVMGQKERVLWGAGSMEDTLLGLRFRISPRSFYQVNRIQAERLYTKAIEAAGLNGSQTVLDLYCGTGTITLAMARHAKKAVGAEIVEQAVTDARENAARNGIQNTEFVCGDAGEMSRRFREQGGRPDVIVVDPPRKGLDEGVIREILQMAPDRLVYVSCDPATLARDVKLFCAGGFRLSDVCAVDMFPRTAHCESICLLQK